jgi:hypothetical protein
LKTASALPPTGVRIPPSPPKFSLRTDSEEI